MCNEVCLSASTPNAGVGAASFVNNAEGAQFHAVVCIDEFFSLPDSERDEDTEYENEQQQRRLHHRWYFLL